MNEPIIGPITGRVLQPPKTTAPLACDRVSFSGPLWHVPVVESGAEIDIAEDVHNELGFPVFLPVERVWTVKRGRRVQVAKPLFVGYLFVRVHPYREDWGRLLDVDGVHDVLGRPHTNDGHPAYVPTAWIDAMRKAQDMGIFDRTTPRPEGFEVGETVRISDGVFAGWNAEIQGFIAKMRSATAKKRAKLLVQFMGRMCSTELDVTALEKL